MADGFCSTITNFPYTSTNGNNITFDFNLNEAGTVVFVQFTVKASEYMFYNLDMILFISGDVLSDLQEAKRIISNDKQEIMGVAIVYSKLHTDLPTYMRIDSADYEIARNAVDKNEIFSEECLHMYYTHAGTRSADHTRIQILSLFVYEGK